MENEQFPDWYRKRFNELNEAPPDGVWNVVSDRLDVEEVWKGVDSKLSRIEARKKITSRISYSLLLLLLLGGAVTFIFFPTGQISDKGPVYETKFKREKAESTDQVEKNIISAGKDTKSAILSGSIGKPSVPEHGVSTTTVHSTNSALHYSNWGSAMNTDPVPDLSDHLSDFIPLPVTLITVYSPDTSFLQISGRDSLTPGHWVKKEITGSFKGFYFGGVYTYKNTWLLNNSTFNGLSSGSLDQTDLHFGHAFGFSGGYYFTPKWSAELNWYFNSQQGQTYHVYNEGEYFRKQIKLDFMLFNISMKQNQAFRIIRKNLQTSDAFLTGVNFSILKVVKDESGLEPEQVRSDYSDFDYGLRIGYEYNLLFHNNILLSPALISDFGLKNIYKGNSASPGSFNRTYNASLGFNISIKYLLGRKKSLK